MSVDLDYVRAELGWITRVIYEDGDLLQDHAKYLLTIALDLYAALHEREAVSANIGTAA